MKFVLILLLAALIGAALWIRIAPSDPARWNVDPVAAADPGGRGVRVAPGTLNFDTPPEELLSKLDGLMRARGRTETLAGVPGDLQITYIARSKWLGFPDYLTFRVLPVDGRGSTLAVLSRSRFGRSDQNVNRDRMEDILSELRQIAE